MTTLNLHSKTDAAGYLKIDEVSLGVPNAEVDVLLTVRPKVSKEEFRRRLEKAAASIDPSMLETYPSSPVRDPWEAS